MARAHVHTRERVVSTISSALQTSQQWPCATRDLQLKDRHIFVFSTAFEWSRSVLDTMNVDTSDTPAIRQSFVRCSFICIKPSESFSSMSHGEEIPKRMARVVRDACTRTPDAGNTCQSDSAYLHTD